MQLHCPHCFAHFSLDSAVQDEAGRELMGLLAKHDVIARQLVIYLGLFRSQSRKLAWDRALRIAKEVVALGDGLAVADALARTVEAMREKQDRGQFKPLKNNQYLKQVLASVEPTVNVVQRLDESAPQAMAPSSKKGKALVALQELKHD